LCEIIGQEWEMGEGLIYQFPLYEHKTHGSHPQNDGRTSFFAFVTSQILYKHREIKT
jgi:hypothetical protein